MPSRSDKIFQKRKAQNKRSLSRKKATLSERSRALIVCEGEKTEPNYILSLTHSLSLTTADVVICGECDSAPISIVNFADEKYQKDQDYEYIFFVFDKDDHASYQQALDKIKSLASQRAYKNCTLYPITSIPCFEIWFLMHFEMHAMPYSAGSGRSAAANLIKVLMKKPEFENYEKAQDNVFNTLEGRLPLAIRNSSNRLKQSLSNGDREHFGNPSTQMHLLVTKLQEISKNSNP